MKGFIIYYRYLAVRTTFLKAVFHAKYTYELDTQNNWIVMKDYRPNHGDELSELLVREIQYY